MPAVPVAVVGLAALMPGARDVSEYWRNIVTGRDLIIEVPPTHWSADDFYDEDPAAPDRTYARRGAFLPEIDFDPLAHGLPPTTLAALDPAQLLGLVVADALLADLDAGLAGPLERERVSVILGSSTLSRVGAMDARIQRPVWLKALREQGIPEADAQAVCDRIAARYVPWQEATFPGLLSNVVAGRIANRLDLHGTNCTVDAACASSLAAVAAAVNVLSLGQADLVVTGGVDATNNPLMYVCFSKTPALSPTGDVRPFSADADGTMLGEGVAMLALKRLDAAERDGDRVYAVIRGVGSSSDGRGGAIYAPMPSGQVLALRRAYEAAGYGPETVELVEAHGTGTSAGDAAEIASLRSVFGSGGPWCALGTVKSQIGHTKAAAGAAGLVKAVMALHQRVLPPTIKVTRPAPGLDGGPFYVNTVARPWVRAGDHRRRASVSSFGFGGANFHVTLEEYPGTHRFRVLPSELVLLSASSPAELFGCPRFDPAAPVRLAVVARDDEDRRAKLDQAAARVARDPATPFSLPGGVWYDPEPPAPGRVAFLFPGQGAQYVGMGADVAMAFPEALEVWDVAARSGLGLHEVVFPPPAFTDEDRAAQERRLTDTRWAQPALAAHSLSLLALLASVGVTPSCVAGHSLGELVALHAAGALDAETLLRLTSFRGTLMSRASDGAMLAVAGKVEPADGVWPANLNSPQQTVVSGSEAAIEALRRRLSSAGVTTRRLAVSAAFHSPLVASAVAPLREYLAGLPVTSPKLDVYANSDGQVYDRDPEAVRSRLAEHATSPVHFQAQIEAMYAAGVRTFVEVGAGAVLTGLVDQILGERDHLAVPLDRRGRDGVTTWHDALARLAVRGVPMTPPTPPAPNPPPRRRMSVPINGTGYREEPVLPSPEPANSSRVEPAPVSRVEPATSSPVEPAMPEPAHPTPSPEWLTAMAELQRQTAEAHMNFQNVLAEAHRTFLHLAETTFATIAGTPPPHSVAPPTTPMEHMLPAPHMAPPTATPPAPPPAAPMAAAPMAAAPMVGQQVAGASMLDPSVVGQEVAAASTAVPPVAAGWTAAQSAGAASMPAPSVAGQMASGSVVGQPVASSPLATSPSAVSSPPIPEAFSASQVSVPVPAVPVVNVPMVVPKSAELGLDLLLEVVADKTGYPVEMLDGAMDLETDLGIDSIKKVEIFADVRRRVPGMPPADSPEMAQLFQLRTLDQIVRHASGPRDPSGNGDPEPPPLRRLVLRSVPAPASGRPLPGLSGDPLTVIGDDGLARAVVERLDANGIRADVKDFPGADDRGVILLGGTARDAFRVARAVAAGMTERGGVFVTVQDAGSTDGLAALARTAALEWPLAAVKAIECARVDVAEAVVTELLTGGATLDVALHADGSRWTVVEEETPAPQGTSPVTAESVLVVTGGARGVTAAAVRALAACGPRILLIGRTPLTDEPPGLAEARDEKALVRAMAEHAANPAEAVTRAREVLAVREIRDNLAAFERAGATVRYAAVDVTDADALRREVDRARREWGPITGVVHGAGVLADKLIADKTDEQFDRVYATKVDGWHALVAATEEDPLALLCAFSSVAARYGNPGQCDYAMANDALDHLARAEKARRPDCVVRSVAWGPWHGGMVTDSLADRFAERGIPLIPPAAGANAFLAETGAADTVGVLIDAGPGRTIVADGRTHLADHAPAGTPVLPLALAAEWLMSAARARSLAELRVLRRVELPARLTIDIQPDELRLRGDHPHYRAHPTTTAVPRAWPAPTGPPADAVYDHPALFHGPAFHVVQRVDALSPAGVDARVLGARTMGWPGGPWWTDPAAVDGALQAAVLWAAAATGAATLPMAVAELHVHRTGPAPGPLRCVVVGGAVSDGQSRCDAALLDDDGRPRIELFGVTLVRRPDMSGP